MNVVVIGMGAVGQYIAKIMVRDGHEVLAVDNDQEKINQVSERMDLATLQGYGANPRTLQLARVENADLVVCTTQSDEVNLIAALASKRVGATRTVARLKSGEYEDTMSEEEEEEGLQYGMFGIDMVVNSHILVADEMFDIARSHGALDVHMFANDQIELAEVQLPEDSKVLGIPLYRLEFPTQTRIGAVIRDEQIFVPNGSDTLLAGDRVFLFGLTDGMHDIEDLFVHGKSAHRVVIYGGNVIGESLSRQLAKVGVDVTIIEECRDTAKRLSLALSKVTIVHGDGTDMTKLEEEGVGRADLYFAVTEDDENNMMSCLLAKRLGTPRVCSVVYRHPYIEIYRQLGIDMAISPRQVAADHILQFARPAQIEAVINLGGGEAEVLEVVAAMDSPITAAPLSEVNIPKGVSIGGIMGIGSTRVPGGDDKVEPGDTVVVMALSTERKSVEKLFKRGMF